MKGIHSNLKQLKMDTVSPATRLLDKRRLMYQVQEAFERQKEEEARRLEMFNNKEEELRARDLAVQEKFVEFSKVINENEAKMQRANNRIAEEKKAIEAKEKRKKELEEKVSELKSKAATLEKSVTAMKAYEEFLENVRAKNPEEFTEINDILLLEGKLRLANDQLRFQQKQLEEENQKIRSIKDQLEKRKKDEILQLNIEIAQKSKQCEETEGKRLDLNKLAEQISAKTVYKQVEIGHIFMAIDNLYMRCAEEGGPKINHNSDLKFQMDPNDEDVGKKFEEVMDKLRIIKAYLNDYKTIVQKAQPPLLQKCKNTKELSKILPRELTIN
ncbi:hypothetical protein SteCoe_15642 [Stentor coeruleus]|uniref:DUF4200 domain-containing protein n=1 Tax=Stentor coeruleus TaxID=5963 RepID=A0A1R2C317_9CILI|nr:hypothetical protein SteCoe_15642 [Stentor coeruleus]